MHFPLSPLLVPTCPLEGFAFAANGLRIFFVQRVTKFGKNTRIKSHSQEGSGLTPYSAPRIRPSTKDGSRKAFVDGLSPYDRKMLDKAQVYELRMSSLRLDARRIFPMEIKGYPTATKKLVERFQTNPRAEVLLDEMSRAAK